MSAPVNLDSKNFLPAKDAASIAGFTPDYIARLCRLGRIDGKKIGKAWFVDEQTLQAFLTVAKDRREARAQELSVGRKEEYQSAQGETAPAFPKIFSAAVAGHSFFHRGAASSLQTLALSRGIAVALALLVAGTSAASWWSDDPYAAHALRASSSALEKSVQVLAPPGSFVVETFDRIVEGTLPARMIERMSSEVTQAQSLQANVVTTVGRSLIGAFIEAFSHVRITVGAFIALVSPGDSGVSSIEELASREESKTSVPAQATTTLPSVVTPPSNRGIPEQFTINTNTRVSDSLSVGGSADISGGLTVNGLATLLSILQAQGGINTSGANVDLQGGQVFASNVVNQVTAGRRIQITGPVSNPTITALGGGGGGSISSSFSLNGISSETTLAAGTDVTITTSGSTITLGASSTLSSVRGRGGCTGCILDADIENDLVLETLGIGTSTPTGAFAIGGPIYLGPTTTPSDTSDRLYNVSGDIYWDGTVLTGTSIGQWTLASGDVYRATGDVGIGTTSPHARFSIAGVAAASSPLVSISTTTSGNATSTAFFIDSLGRVGIGTSSPSHELSVSRALLVGGTATSTFEGGISSSGLASSDGFVLSGGNLTLTSGATSTANNGLNLTGGCFGINGTCTLSTTDIDTYSELNAIVADVTLTSNDLIDTSSELAGIITDETGTGLLVFNTLPTLQGFISNASSTVVGDFTITGTFRTGTLASSGAGTSTFTGGVSSAGLASSQGLTLTGGNILSTSGATSTLDNGFNITAGCFSVNGTCLSGSGSGTVGSGTTGQTAYYASDDTTLTATSTIFLSSDEKVGIGTSSPYSKLSVWNDQAAVGANVFEITNTASTTLLSVTDQGTLAVTNGSASSTFSGGLAVSGDIAGDQLFLTGATSTGANGFDISTGCYAINGSCLSVTGLGGIDGSGAANRVAYFSDADTLTSSASFLFDGTNLGIGTTTTGTLLSLGGIANFTTATSSFYSSGGLNLSGGCFAINGACINESFGVSTYLALSDTPSSFTTNAIPYTNAGATALLHGGLTFDGSTLTTGTLVATGTAATSTLAGGLAIETSGFVYDFSTNNVGIGTTSPGTKLSIDTVGNFTSGTSTLYGGLQGPGFTATSSGVTISGGNLLISSSATSTANNGLTLTGGCFSLSGTCTLSATDINTYTKLNTIVADVTLTSNDLIDTSSELASIVGDETGTGLLVFNTLPTLQGFLSSASSTVVGNLTVGGSGTLTITGGATSTANNGFDISAGCYAVSGTCLTTGATTFLALTDTQSSFVANRIIHTNSAGNALTDTAGFVFDGTNFGVGTTSPHARLSIAGNTTLDSNVINLASSTASTLTVNYATAATSTIVNNQVYAFSIATSTTATPIFSIDTSGTGDFDVAATTTINGGLNVNSGALTYDYSANRTAIERLDLGNMKFEDDAGVVSWIDLPITSSVATGTEQSYTAQIDATSVLTLYGEADGSGGVTNIRTVVGTSTSAVLASTNIPYGSLLIADGILCVDDGGAANCDDASRTRGSIYSESSSVTAIDLAENYPTVDETLQAGELVMWDAERPVYVERYDGTSPTTTPTILNSFVGVVSTKPGVLLGAFADTDFPGIAKVPVTLVGRVPVKVSSEGGPIAVGDRLAPASLPGYATKATSTGMTLGIALESFATSTTSTSTIVAFINPSYHFADGQFAVNATGRVGIGTSTPAYDVHVVGDVAANAFINISTEENKKNIAVVPEVKKKSILERIRGLDLYTYNYTTEGKTAPARLGLIAERAPEEVLSVTKDGVAQGVDIYKLTTFTLAGVQELAKKVDELDTRVIALEELLGVSSTTATSTATTTSKEENGVSLLALLKSWGITFVDGLVSIVKLAAQNLTVGSPERPTGITLYDEQTGEAYCVRVRGGELVNIPGECKTLEPDETTPYLELVGETPLYIEEGTVYEDVGVATTSLAIASSTLFFYINEEAVEKIDINTNVAGDYRIAYVYSDEVGGHGTTTRTVVISPKLQAQTQEQPVGEESQGPVVEIQVPEEVGTSTPPAQTATTTPPAETKPLKEEPPAQEPESLPQEEPEPIPETEPTPEPEPESEPQPESPPAEEPQP